MASTFQSPHASNPPQAQAAPAGNPFAKSTSLIEVLPHEIDIEEELRVYEDMCDVSVSKVR